MMRKKEDLSAEGLEGESLKKTGATHSTRTCSEIEGNKELNVKSCMLIDHKSRIVLNKLKVAGSIFYSFQC